MGNQIVATAPAQILSLESYFTELTEYSKPVSLGSTRFLKVARATHSDGTEVVVKVFAKHDPLLHLDSYKTTLMEYYTKLYTTANVLPFQHFWETEKAAYLVRQHIHYSLYDRFSTRPFLSSMEKRWIIFQLLKVLEECDRKKINHGDIKTENVLLTSWNWVMLTDFASFKPTLLPEDNPADFSFFFDTSRRRTCYLAPERFCPPEFFQEAGGQSIGIQRSRVLTHQMDIFSLGCVIAELFLDGSPLFTLSQLLEYCSTKDREHFEGTLKKINDKLIRRMVRHMTQQNPRERLTASEYLTLYRENVFPDCFYSFLHDYFRSCCITVQLTPDQWIQKLYEDIDAILANVILNNRQQDRESGYGDALVIVLSAITSHMRMAQHAATKLQALQMMKQISVHVTDECILERVVPYVVYLVKDIWASVRAESIRTVTQCLSLVKHLPSTDYNLFLEYILPAMNYIPSDKDVIVRLSFAECVAELAQTAHRFLELAQLHHEDDTSLFHYQVQGSYDSELMQLQESFQGKIVHLLSDTESSVKKAFLNHSAGKLCVFFGPQRAKEVILSHMITFLNDKSDWELHKAFFECIVSVATLLRHHSLPILEPLLQQGLSSGEEMVVCKTIEAMTTLCAEGLYDKQMLFENITTLAPFLVYPNRWVIYGTVGFLMAAGEKLDNVDRECFLLPHVVPYLQTPIIQLHDQCVFLSALKEPIPRAVLDYILKKNVTEIFDCLTDRARARRNITYRQDSSQRISYPKIEGHLIPIFKKLQSLGLNEEHENSLLALKDHILKQHFSKQQYSEVESHYSNARGVVNIKNLPNMVVPRNKELAYKSQSTPLTTTSTSSYSKKKSNQKTGSVGSDKSQVVNEDWDRIFGEPAPKAKDSTPTSKSKKPPSSPEARRRAEVTSETLPRPKSPLKPSHGEQAPMGQVVAEGRGSLLRIQKKTQVDRRSGDHSSFEMSRSSESIVSSQQPEESGRGKGSELVVGSPLKHKRSQSEGAIVKLMVNDRIVGDSASEAPPSGTSSPPLLERSTIKVEYASCRESLKELLSYKQKQYEEDMRFMDVDLTRNASFQTSPGWIPKGQLIAHIHDHRDAVNRIRVLPDSSMFASFSNDGCTKLWDVSRIEAKTVANRPKMTYSHQGGQIKTGTFCQVNRSIATASTNGSIHILNIDPKKTAGGGSKRQLVMETIVDPVEHGTVVEMATFSTGGEEIICYATSMGKLAGLDLRSGKPAWELSNSSKFGLTLSMAVDPFENWVALGTSLGYHVIWDMRFQLPIRHWQHTGHGKFNIHHVYRLSSHPTQPSSLISAVSHNNEISIWDMETASRRQMLWASPAPAFGEMTNIPRQHETVRALSTCIIDNCPVVLGGGTDRTIRLWNLVDPTQCSCVVRPKPHSKRINIDYVSRITEGVDVFTEVHSVSATPSSSGQIGSSHSDTGPAESSHSSVHVDFITDLAVVPYKQLQFIVSASQDGVIKYWK